MTLYYGHYYRMTIKGIRSCTHPHVQLSIPAPVIIQMFACQKPLEETMACHISSLLLHKDLSLPSYPSSPLQWWGIMSELMADINQGQQSTSTLSCPSVITLSLPVCKKGGWSPPFYVLSHLVYVNMDLYSSQNTDSKSTAVCVIHVHTTVRMCHPPRGTGRWL